MGTVLNAVISEILSFCDAEIGCSKNDIPASLAFFANSIASLVEYPSLASAEKKHLSKPI